MPLPQSLQEQKNSTPSSPEKSDVKRSLENIALYRNLIPANIITAATKKVPSERPNTLKMFRTRIESLKEMDLLAMKMGEKKSGIKDHITTADSLLAVKCLMEKSKREYDRKRKEKTTGSMHVNDLWGHSFERSVIKMTRLDKELEKQDTTQHTKGLKEKLEDLNEMYKNQNYDNLFNETLEDIKAKKIVTLQTVTGLPPESPQRTLHDISRPPTSSSTASIFKTLQKVSMEKDYAPGTRHIRQNKFALSRASPYTLSRDYSFSIRPSPAHSKERLKLKSRAASIEKLMSYEPSSDMKTFSLKLQLPTDSKDTKDDRASVTPINYYLPKGKSKDDNSPHPQNQSSLYSKASANDFSGILGTNKKNKHKRAGSLDYALDSSGGSKNLSLVQTRRASNFSKRKEHVSFSTKIEEALVVEKKAFREKSKEKIINLIERCDNQLETKNEYMELIKHMKGTIEDDMNGIGKRKKDLKTEIMGELKYTMARREKKKKI